MINGRSTSPAHERDSPTNYLHPARPSLLQLLSAPAGANLWDGIPLGEAGMNHGTGTILVWGRSRTPSLVKGQHSLDQERIASGLSFCQTYTCLWCALDFFLFNSDLEVTPLVAFQIHKYHVHNLCFGRSDPYQTMGSRF